MERTNLDDAEPTTFFLFDVLGVGLLDMDPLTEEELSATYDQMAEARFEQTEEEPFITEQEFIENALQREADILAEDVRQR